MPSDDRSVWRRMWDTITGQQREERRAITSLSWVQGGPSPSVASAEQALTAVPVFGCVRILADNIASLPIQAFRKAGDRREPVPLPSLLASPAATDNAFQWVHKAVVSLALRGNAYGLIVARDEMGLPTQIEWLSPDDVFVDDAAPTLPIYYVQGAIVPREMILHIPWVVPPGKAVGLSPIAAFARTIGVGLKAEQYGARWFETGIPPATMRNTEQTVTPDESAEIRDRLMSAMRSGKPLVYGSDWQFEALQISPEEAQFLETIKANATQIATIYGVPPEKVGGTSGDSMTYANVEQASIDLVTFTLRPWIVRLESAIKPLLPEGVYIRFNTDALIRTDLLTRYRAHHLALLAGWRNRDETRAIEDLPPIPDGTGQLFSQSLYGQPDDDSDAMSTDPGPAAEGGAAA